MAEDTATTRALERIVEELTRNARASAQAQNQTMSAMEQMLKRIQTREKKLSEIFDSLSTGATKFERSMVDVKRAMDDAVDNDKVSNAQIDKVTKDTVENLKGLINSSTDLSAQFKTTASEAFATAKTYNDLSDVVEAANNSIEDYTRLQSSFGDSLSDVQNNLRKVLGLTADQAAARINLEIETARVIKALEIEAMEGREATEEELAAVVEETSRNMGRLLASDIALNKTVVKQREVFENVSKEGARAADTLKEIAGRPGQEFVKYLDKSKTGLIGHITELFTAAKALQIFWQGLKQAANNFVKLNAIGLAGTFVKLEAAAVRYGVSFDTLMKITDQNRVAMYREVLSSGGKKTFDEVRAEFLDTVHELGGQGATDIYGMDKGREVAAGHLNATQEAGISPMSAKGKAIASATLKSQLELQKIYGESAETYLSNISAINKLDESQMLLASATEDQRAVILQNTAAQYEQYRILGLTAEQAREKLRKEREDASPFKGALDALKSKILGPQLFTIKAAMAGIKISRETVALANSTKFMSIEDLGKMDADQRDKILKARLEVGQAESAMQTKTTPGSVGAIAGEIMDQNMGTKTIESIKEASKEFTQNKLGQGMTEAGKSGLDKKRADDLKAGVKDASESIGQGIQKALQAGMNIMDSSIGKIVTGIVLGLGAWYAASLIPLLTGGITAVTGLLTGILTAVGGRSALGAVAGGAARFIPHAAALAGGYAIGDKLGEKGLEYQKEKLDKNIAENDEFIKRKRAEVLERQKASGKPTVAETGKAAASTPTISPERKKLLDVIAGGESSGRYDIFTGGDKADLENMTLAQVMDLQKQRVSAGKDSAAGRYQITNRTMKETIARMNLDPNTTKYDKATQDMMGNNLLEHRGVARFESGQMSKDAFMKGLSQEWGAAPFQQVAGKPVGALDGINGNKANIPFATMSAAVDQLKTPGAATQVATAQVTPTQQQVATFADFDKNITAKLDESNSILAKILAGINKLSPVGVASASPLPSVPKTTVNAYYPR
jgi:hypothetical protein